MMIPDSGLLFWATLYMMMMMMIIMINRSIVTFSCTHPHEVATVKHASGGVRFMVGRRIYVPPEVEIVSNRIRRQLYYCRTHFLRRSASLQ